MSANPFRPVLRRIREKFGLAAAGPDDALLLERFTLSGDESAFAALVARHGPMVWGTCRRVAGFGIREDGGDHRLEIASHALAIVFKYRGDTADGRAVAAAGAVADET